MTGFSMRSVTHGDLTPVLDALTEALIKVDSQWVIQYLNPAAARMLNVIAAKRRAGRSGTLPLNSLAIWRRRQATRSNREHPTNISATENGDTST